MMASRLFPFFAAVVQNPARRECPPRVEASRPATVAVRWTMRATLRSLSAAALTLPWRSMLRKSGPSVMADAASQAASARTGHNHSATTRPFVDASGGVPPRILTSKNFHFSEVRIWGRWTSPSPGSLLMPHGAKSPR